MWAKAPLVLRRWPAILAAVVAAAFVLGVTAASPKLFLSSSASDALDRAIAESTRYGAGLTIALHDDRRARIAGSEGPVSTAAARDRALGRATAGIPHLDEAILSILSGTVPVSADGEETARANPVRLVYRSGFVGRLPGAGRASGGDRAGAWVQDVTADALGVAPGDDMLLHGAGGRTVRVAVAGVYEALANSPPDPYWEPLAQHFRPPAVDSPLPPPFVLLERPALEALMDRLGHSEADFQWEYPLAASAELDLGSAAALVRDYLAFGASLQDTRSETGRHFRCETCLPASPLPVDVRSTLEQDVLRAEQTAASLRPSIELLAVAGLLTALVVLGAAGLYLVGRRRTEMRLLVARGVAPVTLGVKTAAECAVPVVLGAAAGVVVATFAMQAFGPGRLAAQSLRDAARSAGVMVPVALAVVGAVAAASAGRFSPRRSRRAWGRAAPWEIPLLALAGLGLRFLLAEDALVAAGDDVQSVSPWLLVFPVLFVGGGGGLAARGFKHILSAVGTPRLRVRPSLYLALNRLATARRLALMLITASALAFGIFLYAQTMASSVRATTTAKSYVFTGSDVTVPIDRQYSPPDAFPWPHTTVSSKLDAARLQPADETIDMLAVDVSTFARAAYWDASFSDRTLEELMRGLAEPADGTLAAVVAGRLDDGATLEVGGVAVPYEVVARVDAFPGQFVDRTLFVVDRDAAGPVIEEAGALNPITAAGSTASMWVKGDSERIVASLGDLGFAPDDALTADQVLENPSFVAVSRTFGFLQALGGLAAGLVLVGILLYVQTRQRARAVSYALARRMGLRARSHYAALALELAAMLLVALLAGAVLGITAARLVYARIDLLPTIPPPPLLRVPFDAIVPALAGILLAAGAGAFLGHRSAERADVAEALRSGA